VRELRERFRSQHALATRTDLRLLGVTAAEERRRRAVGEWELAGPGALRLAGSPQTRAEAPGGLPGRRAVGGGLAPVRLTTRGGTSC